MARKLKTIGPVTAYAHSVVDGKVPAGRLQRLASQRHLRDLDRQNETGLHFNEKRAQAAIDFFPLLRHSKGKWAGQPFVLSPWQQFCTGAELGWERADGQRRFRTAWEEVPRKNGKSTRAAGMAIYLAFFDGEPGAEVYCAATKRDQAKIVFSEAQRMVRRTPGLSQRIASYVGNLSVESSASKLEPLGADADTMDGLNIHGATVDEVHAHRNRAMVDVLETATGARLQPLILYTTTAGHDRTSVGWELHDYAVKVLERVVDDETFFAFIACADEGDDWRVRKTWAKANPNLGVSVYEDDLERKADRARKVPGAENAFRRLHCNEWTEQVTRWLPMEAWDDCKGQVQLEALRGRRCVGGLDLGSTRDTTAFVLVFQEEDDGFTVLPFFWLPKEGIGEREVRDHVPYREWADRGFITLTDGPVTDYRAVRQRIGVLSGEYQITAIAYDKWNATETAHELSEAGATMVELPQRISSLAEAVNKIEVAVLSGKLRHGGHPVLRWMAANSSTKADQEGNRRIVKPTDQTKRVDGMSALANAVAWLVRKVAEQESVYNDSSLRPEGLLSL